MKNVFFRSILVIFFMLFTSHLDEHDFMYIIHSHQTTGHSHQEHHKTQSQLSTSVTARRTVVASNSKNIMSRNLAFRESLAVHLINYKTCYHADIPLIPLNHFTKLII